MNKWKIGLICGIVWGIVSFYFWMMLSGGPTSGNNPSIVFGVLTLPASVLILINYYIIDLPVTLTVCLIPILGASIGMGIGYLIDRFKK